MNKTDFIKFLKNRLEKDMLPGMNALAEMAPLGRQLNYPVDSNYADSAVAVLLFKKEKELFFPLIKRTGHNKNDKHRGQISLPGGRFDSEDNTLLNCAIREAREELGINIKSISTLGKLTKLFIPVSSFMVQPFVFFIEDTKKFQPQESEVEYVLEVKLSDLLKSANKKKGEVVTESGIKLNNIPYFDLNNHIVWGATAMILNEFKNVAVGFKTK